MKQRLKKYRKILNALVSSNKCILILLSKLHIRKTKLDYKIWGEYNFASEVQRNFNLFLSAKEIKDEQLCIINTTQTRSYRINDTNIKVSRIINPKVV